MDPTSTPSPSSRTIRRIVVEAAFVALLGGLVCGILLEAGFHDAAWIVAIVIWCGGTPLLEIVRLLQARGHRNT